MTCEQQNFAVTMTDQCTTHEQWLSVMRFGMGTLIEDSAFLVELIVREAERERDRTGLSHRRTSDDAAAIFRRLGLRVVVCDAETPDRHSPGDAA